MNPPDVPDKIPHVDDLLPCRSTEGRDLARRRIAPKEARAMALRIMDEARLRLHEERVAEAEFLVRFFDKEESP